jgi:putative ABC transport system ATP-binding protein
MSVLELRSVSKVYGKGAAEVQALMDVSMRVEAGSMVAVMGPSGSGKSTLLTIAGTLEEPTSGAVLIGGQDVARMAGGGKPRQPRSPPMVATVPALGSAVPPETVGGFA